MLVLGVTGGIGSGKTTVCQMLETLGARAFYADPEAKKLMHTPQVRQEIEAAFGSNSYHNDGTLNRPYLAQHVFSDKDSLARINSIVHPRVFAALQAAIDTAKADGIRLFVYESALIFSGASAAYLDAILVVEAPAASRIDRVTARDQITADRVTARMRHQLSPEAMRERADYVIANDGSLEELRDRVQALYRTLMD